MAASAVERSKRLHIRTIKSIISDELKECDEYEAGELIRELDDETTKYYSLCEEVIEASENDEEETITELIQIKTAVRKFKAKLQAIIDQAMIEKNQKSLASTMSETTSIQMTQQSAKSQTQVKLPEISIPKFNGDIQKWLEFKDLFNALIHTNEMLSNTQKMYYLRSVLEGEAVNAIQNLECTEANYTEAWELLTNRYSSARLLVNSHLKSLSDQPAIVNETEVRTLLDNVTRSIRALSALGYPDESKSLLLTYQLTAKLPKRLRREWELNHKNADHIPTFDELKEFLEKQTQASENLWTTNNDRSKDRPGQTNNTSEKCPHCKKLHAIFNCPDFIKADTTQKYEILKTSKICTNCLRVGHNTMECKSLARCKKCLKKHNTLLHRPLALSATAASHESGNKRKCNRYQKPTTAAVTIEENAESEKEIQPELVEETKTLTTQIKPNGVLLPSAIVKLKTPNGTFTKVRIILDCCSQSEFVTEDVVKKCSLPLKKSNLKITGIGGAQPPSSTYKTTLEIYNNSGLFSLKFEAYIMSKIIPEIPSISLDVLNEIHERNIQLADPTITQAGTIDVLIGAKFFNCIITDGFMDGFSDDVTLRNSKFGWLVFGSGQELFQPTAAPICCFTLTEQLNKFWELEEPTSEFLQSPEEAYCETFFQKTTTIENNRFKVRLPFKHNVLENSSTPPKLGSTLDTATSQLRSLENRFEKNPQLKKEYTNFINEYITQNHMQETKPTSSYFMPHHCVWKRESKKLRVVFNASQKDDLGTSLNEAMCIGPVVQRDIFDILVTFRMYEIPMVADIKQMYRQILMHENDRVYQQILWRNESNQKLKFFQLNTVTYGTAAAPFLATRCIKEIGLQQVQQNPNIAEKILNNFYVDDFVSGANSANEALEVKQAMTQILQNYGFELAKWRSTIPEINDNENLLWSSSNEKTLGVLWNPMNDEFSFKNAIKLPSKQITKRIVLSQISKIFDPLGFLAPITIIGKLLMRNIWNLPVEWDTELEINERQQFQQFIQILSDITTIQVPRNLHYANATVVNLHVFCDASEKAYAAAIYIQTLHPSTNKIFSTLLCAKTKLAPMKPTSIPRLELCSAVLAAKLIERLLPILKINVESCHAWSDSTIVLSWLAKHPSQWKPFVANRVTLIQKTIPCCKWRHISTHENPADLATRGKDLQHLKNSDLWWQGPAWLTKPNLRPISSWKYNKDSEKEIRKQKTIAVPGIAAVQDLGILEKFSKLPTLLRVTAWCYRFITNLKRTIQKTPLIKQKFITVPEYHNATQFWVKVAQSIFQKDITRLQKGKPPKNEQLSLLCPAIEPNGILRVGGRLKNTNWAFNKRCPIIIPPKHQFTILLIDFYHETFLHAPLEVLNTVLRQHYWIINGKSAIKKRLRNCIKCQKQRLRLMKQLMGNLPSVRVQPVTKPFLHVGVDYAGPIIIQPMIRTRATMALKAYICLFICMQTKAVHIEAVSSLSAKSFIATFTRFVCRRGIPQCVYSDNGTNFVASNHLLKKQFSEFIQSDELYQEIQAYTVPREIEWSFIPPSSPHFGGLWESNIKTVKKSLYTIVGEQKLTFEELITLLSQIEANMNSRPISANSNDPDDLTCLTPGHFLVFEPLTALPQTQRPDPRMKNKDRWELIQRFNEQIWNRWANEYIAQIQKRNKWKFPQDKIEIGDLVMVQQKESAPTQWALGRITQTFPGDDGYTRVVELKTKDGYYRRPITKIAKLFKD